MINYIFRPWIEAHNARAKLHASVLRSMDDAKAYQRDNERLLACIARLHERIAELEKV